jgi:TRAP-type C4-dicarboxylate transport system substrate-binding protein
MRIDPVGGAPLEAYGAVLNNVIAPEIYAAMEKGMLDGVMAIWTYYFGAYKLNELSKYATIGIDLKVTPMYLLVSKTAWAALPPEWQKLASDWAATKTNAKFKEYMDIDDAKWLPIYQKQLEISTLPAAERAKLVEKAKPAWDKWVKEMAAKGLPGQEVLNYAMAERDKILAKK